MPDGINRDMASPRPDFSAELGVTNNRVGTLERAVTQLGAEQQQLGLRLSNEISQVSASLTGELKSITASLAERSKIPWPALGVMLSGVIALGTLVWYPVKDNQNKLETAVQRLAEVSVGKADLEYRLTVSGQRRDDFQRMSEQRDKDLQVNMEQLRERIVPRGEHEEKWRAAEQRFIDTQRQIDDVKRAFGDTFSLRDALQQMQKRIDSLEMKRPG